MYYPVMGLVQPLANCVRLPLIVFFTYIKALLSLVPIGKAPGEVIVPPRSGSFFVDLSDDFKEVNS
ncbi:MAG: hypothetical protein DWP94_04400 [Flavobacterium sp.]|nr:MAG: hypothetical protein DWP94_04400 [Flavobacterium sp.]